MTANSTTTQNLVPHVMFRTLSSGKGLAILTANPIVTGTGIISTTPVITPINLDQNMSPTGTVTLYSGLTYTSTGTITLAQTLVTGTGFQGVAFPYQGEATLQPFTAYLLRVRNDAGSPVSIGIEMEWYEDTP